MGNNSASAINSNISRDNYESSINSAKKEGLESMECDENNNGANINRVWIIKRAISLSDPHLNMPVTFSKTATLIPVEKSIFDIKSGFNCYFKHWAVILELSNGSFVNIQFGRSGFSLEEFNETPDKGRNLLDAIINTWGEKDCPVSFCYLGNANYKYDELKSILETIKNDEMQHFDKNGVSYYNLGFRNCQHFACDIERILFGKIQFWHSFNYYLNDFFTEFFPNIDINELKKNYEKEIKQKNRAIVAVDIFMYLFQFDSHHGSNITQKLIDNGTAEKIIDSI